MSMIRNVWGGPLDLSAELTTEDEVDDVFDRAAYRPPSDKDQDAGDRWLLRPARVKRQRMSLCDMEDRTLMRNLVLLICMAAVVSALVVLMATKLKHHKPATVPDNYTVALHKALSFFNAQRSGRLPKRNDVSWRGDSGLKDEVVGGYYDAGGTMKHSFPASFTMAILSWSVIEYSAKYEAAGELDHVKEIIKWGTDYLLKTFNSSGASIGSVVALVGGDNDQYCWMRPEDMDGDDELHRRATRCSNCPALAAEMAAALAAASIVFQDDYGYSKKLVHGAKLLFKFATKDRGLKHAGGRDPPSRSYNSSGFWDELLWGGTWLYFATGNSSYLQLVTSYTLAKKSKALSGDPDQGVLSWDNKQAGAQLLLTRLSIFLDYGYPYEGMLRRYHENVQDIMCSYLPFFPSFKRTKGGMIMLNHGRPRPLQYVVNAAFLASLYSDYLTAKLIPGWNCGSRFYPNRVLRHFAKRQMDYILGKNPRGVSYVVGFGNSFPHHVHHRGASIPNNKGKYGCRDGWKWRDSKRKNPNVAVGAMVAGPDENDGFLDVRPNYNYTEPTIAGNAGLVAALIALSGEGTSKIDQNTIFHGVPPIRSSEQRPRTP